MRGDEMRSLIEDAEVRLGCQESSVRRTKHQLNKLRAEQARRESHYATEETVPQSEQEEL